MLDMASRTSWHRDSAGAVAVGEGLRLVIETKSRMRPTPPDVGLMDVQMPVMAGSSGH